MTGGILQIVALGAEDIYLTSDPNVTFFKMVYRRHANFSKDELDLSFNNKLSFGKEGFVKLAHNGDLVHRIYLSIKLPQIDIFYTQQTVVDIQKILLDCGITWIPPTNVTSVLRSPDKTIQDTQQNIKFTQILNESAQKAINLKLISLQNELTIIDSILTTLSTNGIFNATIWQTNNPNLTTVDYIEAILDNYFQYDQYNVIYKIIMALISDTINNELLLANSQKIQQLVFNMLFNFVTSEDSNPYTYNDANIQFLYYAMSSNYNIYSSISSVDLFNNSISATYNNLNVTYNQLDAYKIFNYVLKQTEIVINISTSIQTLLTILYNNIYYGLQANIVLLNNTYNSISESSNFIFNRKFINISGSKFNTNALFVNESQILNKNSILNDNFTDKFELNFNINLPPTLYNYYNDNIKMNVTNFHSFNTSLFRTNNFNQYFNDLKLWEKLVVTIENKKIIFLNRIWILMNEDIPKALYQFVSDKLDDDELLEFENTLVSIQNIILKIIEPKIMNELNNNIMKESIVSIKNNDYLMSAIFSPGANSLVLNTTIPEYIINSYIDMIKLFKDEVFYDDCVMIINSFISQEIPDYSPKLQYAFINTQSSIINYIFLSFVNNYNSLYNDSLLSYENFYNNIGSEMLEYLTTISNMYLNYDINNTKTYDYFRNITNIPTSKINDFVDINLDSLIGKLMYYTNNKSLLNIKNILLIKSQFFYEQYQLILTHIIDTIKFNPSTYIYTTYEQSNDIVNITYDILSNTSVEYTEPRNNAIDIINKAKLFITNFLTQTENTFVVDSELYNLWELLKILPLEEQNKIFDRIFGWLYMNNSAELLYSYVLQINSMYNNFSKETDIYNFMKDYIIQHSILKDIPSLVGGNINGTYLNILNYFVNLRKVNRLNYDKISGNDDVSSLSEILNLSVTSGTVKAKFAWIKKIGHYLINNITIKIDDQTITTLYGEWIEIWYSLTKSMNREVGYNKLIGNVVELYTFDNRTKPEYELIIPLPLWFCKNSGVALPLVAMHNSEIKIYVKLREFNEVCYYDKLTTFRKSPKLSCKIIAEYIYVENCEREKIVKNKLQYQIDTLQYNGDLLVTKESFTNINSLLYKTIIRFSGPCKELFWVLQDVSYIDGSLTNGERLWDKYDYNNLNPMSQASIQFNGRDREQLKDAIYYNYIQSYEKHLAEPSLGVNIYSFAIDPTSVQSTGSANMSKIDDASISLTLLPNVMRDLNNNKVIFRLAIYSLSINMLRVCSGLGGLMYYS